MRLEYHPNRTKKNPNNSTVTLRDRVIESESLGNGHSLEAEVTGLHHPFQLVKLEGTGSGTKDVRVALPLINGLSINQGHGAVGASGRQTRRGQGGRGV